MPSVQRTAEVVWSGTIARGTGMASGGSGAIRNMPMTQATRMGEPEGHTSPEELIAAAHAGCFAMSLGSILAGQRTPPERLDVSATVTLEMSGTPTIASSELVARGVVPGSDQARFAAAAEQAERACPVSRALHGDVEIRVRAILEEQPASSAA
jgi:lipoyl-dependent peroxiredoxin